MTYFLIILSIVFLLSALVIINAKQKIMPSSLEKNITSLSKENIRELIKDKTGFANNDGVKIYYESISNTNTPKDTILLINGHSHSLLNWFEDFYQPFVDLGYQVVRYDNRGLGESDWMKDWSRENKYSLEDMAKDGLAVLEHLKIEKAHIVGASMGGMIAQRIAISHSHKVKSLTSIMSTGYLFDEELISTPKPFIAKIILIQALFARNLKTEIAKARIHVAIQHILRGKGTYSYDGNTDIRNAFYEMNVRKGFNGKVSDQHSIAIKKSGSRLEEMKNIQVPTLIIHGTDDPLIKIEHAKKYASLIKHAKTLFIEGMGHDLPHIYLKEIHANILDNIN
jgi:pimeloyl-ACP methyl ester carboxylesterase